MYEDCLCFPPFVLYYFNLLFLKSIGVDFGFAQLTPTEKKKHHYQQTNTLFFTSTKKRGSFFRERETQFLEREIVWLWGFGLGFFFLLGGDDGDWVFLEGDNSHGTFWNYLFFFSLFLEGVVIRLGCVVVALSDCKFDGLCLVS